MAKLVRCGGGSCVALTALQLLPAPHRRAFLLVLVVVVVRATGDRVARPSTSRFLCCAGDRGRTERGRRAFGAPGDGSRSSPRRDPRDSALTLLGDQRLHRSARLVHSGGRRSSGQRARSSFLWHRSGPLSRSRADRRGLQSSSKVSPLRCTALDAPRARSDPAAPSADRVATVPLAFTILLASGVILAVREQPDAFCSLLAQRSHTFLGSLRRRPSPRMAGARGVQVRPADESPHWRGGARSWSTPRWRAR